MTKRIFRSIILVALAVFFASVAIFMVVLYNYFTDMSMRQLKTETSLAARGVEAEGAEYFKSLDTGDYRITWIASDGSVIYDSQTESSTMENHLEREEIQLALENGYGESSRYSSTLTERSLYGARLLPDGSVVRLSVAQSSVLLLLLGMIQPLCIVFAIAVILSMVLASRLSKRIVKPLNSINLDDPLGNEGYDEISPLLNRIAAQQSKIRTQSNELKRKQIEFEAVTEGMHEGIVLLNDKGSILSMNKAASKLLEAPPRFLGVDILAVNKNYALGEVLRKAQNGEAAESKTRLSDGEYQLNATPVNTQSGVSGVVLLIFDITEKEKAEQMRREFTANVSHELKTPLHTISGCAELLKNNMVASEDVPEFAGKIYSESGRMIALVEDIIKLSHLDEGAEDMKRETVNMYEIAQTAVHCLMPAANEVNVNLSLTGTDVMLNGIPLLIQGIIYNLCDNAIKYNREGGSVIADVSEENGNAVLTVTDTGIGIPEEHKDRIFERFYRVDKSHSKEVGGTGLGLSIVKHAAKLHDAKIAIHSEVGVGTMIKVTFPKNKEE